MTVMTINFNHNFHYIKHKNIKSLCIFIRKIDTISVDLIFYCHIGTSTRVQKTFIVSGFKITILL